MTVKCRKSRTGSRDTFVDVDGSEVGCIAESTDGKQWTVRWVMGTNEDKLFATRLAFNTRALAAGCVAGLFHARAVQAG